MDKNEYSLAKELYEEKLRLAMRARYGPGFDPRQHQRNESADLHDPDSQPDWVDPDEWMNAFWNDH